MKFSATKLNDVVLIEPQCIYDRRGSFLESFNSKSFCDATNLAPKFVVDAQSISYKGVLRGLHYQVSPHSQSKLVRVLVGSVWDVSVDLRINSPTFGKWMGVELSAENHKQLWIPSGFAHGFLTLSDTALFSYKTTCQYQPLFEKCIAWNDSVLSIDWPCLNFDAPILSVKDAKGDSFLNASYFIDV